MKGIVFNLLEEAVSREYGQDTWDQMLERAELDGVYTDAIVHWFGRAALPLLADAYPKFFAPHASTRSFVLTLNDIIHPEVRKLYPGADVPVFDFQGSSNGTLVMGYSSPRKLCAFAEGLIEGAAAYYGEVVAIEQPLCMNRGDPKCLLSISFGHASS